MGIFHRRQKQPALPSNIISLMERFGRFELDPQGSGDDAGDIWHQWAELYPFAEADPDGFLVALAEAVLPVGGWAVYGASRTIWECFSSKEIFRQHPAANAIMDAAIEFLRANRVSPMNVRGYEWEYWFAKGGTRDTWLPQIPTPSQLTTNPTNVPSSPEAWVEVGIAHIQNARYAEAVAACDQALQLNSAYAPAYAYKGAALTELDRYTEALAAYDRAFQLDSANAGFYVGKGLVLAYLRRNDEALAAYDRALQLIPADAGLYADKALALAGLKRYTEALAFCDWALQLDPTNAGAYANKGAVLADQGRYEEALAACDWALQLDPTSVRTYTNKGNLLLRLNRFEESLVACDQALHFDPTNSWAYANKG